MSSSHQFAPLQGCPLHNVARYGNTLMSGRTVDSKLRPRTGLACDSNDARSDFPGDDSQDVAASLDSVKHLASAGFLSLRGTCKGLWGASEHLIQNERDEW